MKGEIFMSEKNALVATFPLVVNYNVRIILIDGEIWFAGKDVAKALGYTDTDQAIREHIDEEDKKIFKPVDLTGLNPADLAGLKIPNRGMFFINESGMYALIFSSKLPQAKKFKHWVTSEVLPSIRKYGYYGVEDEKENWTGDQWLEYYARLKKRVPYMTEKEKLDLADDPYIIVWQVNGGKLQVSFDY